MRNGDFPPNNLQEGSTLILLNDDMEIAHEEYELHYNNEEKSRTCLKSILFELLLNA